MLFSNVIVVDLQTASFSMPIRIILVDDFCIEVGTYFNCYLSCKNVIPFYNYNNAFWFPITTFAEHTIFMCFTHYYRY